MDGARGALATTSRGSVLPPVAVHDLACFLELFEGLPASAAVFKELCNQPLDEPELCVRALSATTRLCLQWSVEECGRKVRRCRSIIVWQEWLKADVAPWSVDLTHALVNEVQAHRRQVLMATHCADATPDDVCEMILWAKQTWKSAVLGPCPACDRDVPPRKRLRLECSQLCCRCTLKRAFE